MEPQRLLKKIKTLCKFCDELALLSTCKRLQVAAIVFPIDCSRVYAIGYNGPPSGTRNDACTGKKGRCGCVHAEANAVMKMNLDTARPSVMYTTVSPCLACAGLIVNSGVIECVLYDEVYRTYTSNALLRSLALPSSQINDFGVSQVAALIELWRTK